MCLVVGDKLPLTLVLCDNMMIYASGLLSEWGFVGVSLCPSGFSAGLSPFFFPVGFCQFTVSKW